MSSPYKTFCHAMRSTKCTEYVEHQRNLLGYTVCLPCGDIIAHERRFTIVPMHKSNLVVITNRDDLIGINNKGGLVK